LKYKRLSKQNGPKISLSQKKKYVLETEESETEMLLLILMGGILKN
jgi:hypothetical protein